MNKELHIWMGENYPNKNDLLINIKCYRNSFK